MHTALETASEALHKQSTSLAACHGGRLADKVLIAFHQACDRSDLAVADRLLGILDTIVTRVSKSPELKGRRKMVTTVGLHRRLWQLQFGP